MKQKRVHVSLFVVLFFGWLGPFPGHAEIREDIKQQARELVGRIDRENLIITESYHERLYQQAQASEGDEALRLLRYLLERQITLAEAEKIQLYLDELQQRAAEQDNKRYLTIARLYRAYFESPNDSYTEPLAILETGIENAGEDWMVAALAHRLAAMLRAKLGHMNFALSHARAGLDLLPEDDTDAKDVHYEMMDSLRYTYDALGDPEGVINAVWDALTVANAADRPFDGTTVVYSLTLLMSSWDEDILAFQFSQVLERLAGETNSDIELFYAYYLASRMAYNAEEYQMAIDYAEQADRFDSASSYFIFNLDAARAGSYAALGKSQEARQLLRNLQTYADEHPDIKNTERGALLFKIEAELALGEGRYADALRLYKDYERSHSEILRKEFSAEVKDLRANLEASLEEEKQGRARLLSENQFKSKILQSQKITLSLLMFFLVGAVVAFIWQRRTSDLLKESRKQADIANRAKSDFLATMSHEIRTPMNGILGFANLLLDETVTDQQRDYARTIKKSGEALLAILNDVLDLSKIEAGEIELEELEFDAAEIIDSVIQLMSARAHSKNIELASFVPPDIPPKLIGDPSRLRQVLLNLVNNAVKFTDQGGVSIQLSASGSLEGETLVIRFDIRDTGIGIAGETIPKLFQPFTQADASMSRKYGGTGLGLSICERLVKMMGGEIGVESREGEGALFWFTIKTRISETAPEECKTWDLCHGLKIAVVDDNPVNLHVFMLQLEAAGAEAEIFGNGQDALQGLTEAASSKHPFDAVLTDHMMPEMNGLDLVRAIRENPLINGLKVVLCTSSGFMVRSDAKQLGLDGWLPKPIQQETLYRVIAGLAGKSETAIDPSEPLHKTGNPDSKISDSDGEKKKAFRILLAEDQPINQMVAVRALSKAGFTVDIAGNGFEAIAAIIDCSYDIVLMDIQMPEMDGIEACKRIRKLPGDKARVPIIALTANSMEGDRERYISAGMNDYASKPIDFPSLIEKIREWGDKSEARSAPKETATPL